VSTLPIGLVIEAMVAILLLITIAFCMALNRRIGLLRSDEHMLRATIGDLNTATARAESAIAGLRSIAREADEVLGQRMGEAQGMLRDLEREVVDGEAVLARISAITSAAQPARPQPQAQPQSLAAPARFAWPQDARPEHRPEHRKERAA